MHVLHPFILLLPRVFSQTSESNEFGATVTSLNKSFQRSLDWYSVGQCDAEGPRRGLKGAGEQKVSLPIAKSNSICTPWFFHTFGAPESGNVAGAGLKGGKIPGSVSGV